MSPVLALLAGRALKFILGSAELKKAFAASVRAYKATALNNAQIQALPDDEAAIEKLSADVERAIVENEQIQNRIKARIARGEK